MRRTLIVLLLVFLPASAIAGIRQDAMPGGGYSGRVLEKVDGAMDWTPLYKMWNPDPALFIYPGCSIELYPAPSAGPRKSLGYLNVFINGALFQKLEAKDFVDEHTKVVIPAERTSTWIRGVQYMVSFEVVNKDGKRDHLGINLRPLVIEVRSREEINELLGRTKKSVQSTSTGQPVPQQNAAVEELQLQLDLLIAERRKNQQVIADLKTRLEVALAELEQLKGQATQSVTVTNQSNSSEPSKNWLVTIGQIQVERGRSYKLTSTQLTRVESPLGTRLIREVTGCSVAEAIGRVARFNLKPGPGGLRPGKYHFVFKALDEEGVVLDTFEFDLEVV